MHDFPIAEGDIARRQQTLTALYSDHHAWLHGWLRKKLGCSQHAADLAHDAFIRVLLLAEPHTIKEPRAFLDRKSTRLNSSHGYISYAVFCLKKKTIS